MIVGPFGRLLALGQRLASGEQSSGFGTFGTVGALGTFTSRQVTSEPVTRAATGEDSGEGARKRNRSARE